MKFSLSRLLTFTCLLLLPMFALAQVAWTDPAFPTGTEPVTVYFDAAEGTGGLAGCNCDVYFHAGLITSNSTSNSDWKYVFTTWGVANDDWKMTPVPGEPDVYSWEIIPGIRERFNVTNSGEEIEFLALVFRNADGSKEGKDVGGSDIFLEVYPDNAAFNAGFISPSESSVFSETGAEIAIQAGASQTASLSLFENGNLLTTENGTSLNYVLTVSQIGTHTVTLIADDGNTVITDTFTYVVPKANTIAALPPGMDLGINYISDTEVLFALMAPWKEHVFLIGDFNDWQFSTDYQLRLTPDGEIWWIQIDGLTPGEYYGFQYIVDGEIRIGEPYSNLILDPANDPWIPDEVWPDMPDYPVGKTTGIVSLIHPGATDFPWEINDFERPAQEKLVIYELLMRDWLKQDYNGLTSMLDYFEELGVNAIELMPVNEFDGNISWGYNPTYHYALDKYYGTPDAFRNFVDEAHARGIVVILDVVFNHTHELNPLAQLYWNEAAFRPAADNPWLNEEPTHDFNVFFDFNHESEATQEYVKRTLRHWLNDYRVDGFRFDLSKGFTQNVNGPWHAGNYDPARIAVIKEYADAVWAESADAYVILEHFADNQEEKELSDYGAMLWSGFGPHDEYLEAAMGYSSNLISASYQNRGWDDPHLVVYMESHDEERMMYKNLEYGNGNGSYQVMDFSTALDRVELASAFFYTIPGPKMLWQFGELGYDFSINYCPNGTINNDCRTSEKPIRWDYTENPGRVDVYNVISDLLYLRENYEAFHTDDFDLDVDQYWKTIHLNHNSMNVTVLGNFNVIEETFDPSFQHTGTWYEYFSGNAVDVTDPHAVLTLEPGEYRIYTDEPVTRPGYITGDQTLLRGSIDWQVAPNPASEAFVIVNLLNPATVSLAVSDLQGRQLTGIDDIDYPAGTFQFDLPSFEAGIYYVLLTVNGIRETKKLIVF